MAHKPTPIKDFLREKQQFSKRAVIAAVISLLIFTGLTARLFSLQLQQHEHFTTLAQDNRVKLAPLAPTRGLIYDSNGVILAENKPAYSLEITPEKSKDVDKTIEDLSRVISITPNDLERFYKLKKQKRRFDSVPIRVHLSHEEASLFAVEQHRFPSVHINAQLVRHYPQKYLTAHALGYVGRISKKDLQSIVKSDYAGTNHIGKTGIEKTYEPFLHGKVGLQKIEVNARGRTVRVLEQTPPVPGQDLKLHLNIKLQKVAIEAFGDFNGSAVAINPQNGGILALVSNPGYNPNLFVEGISFKDYKSLQENPDKPLYNRAIKGQYPPGSTVKPFIALSGLESDTIQPRHSTFCPGFFQLPGREHKYRDWKKTGHGTMTIDSAITQSCDVFYYKLAIDMGINLLHETMDKFNFGRKTGIDIAGELSGILPSRKWKRKRYNQGWYPGETVITGIGQGAFLTTPLQLAAATAAIANGGTYYTPRIVDKLINNAAIEWAIPGKKREIEKHDERHWAQIKTAMIHVTEGARGTAKKLRNKHYRVAAKTGTAQVFTVKQDEEYDENTVSEKMRDHALIIAYAPIENPTIAVAVIVENGGHGGSVAGPIAKKIMDAWLLKEDES